MGKKATGLKALIGEREVKMVKYADIKVVSKNNPRGVVKESDKDLKSLKSSVRRVGILQPVTVKTVGKGYELVFGYRRMAVAGALGIGTIPVVVYDKLTPEMQDLLALAENSEDARLNINPMREAKAYGALVKKFKDLKTVARATGAKVSRVESLLGLLEAPKFIQDLVEKDTLTVAVARELVDSDGDWLIKEVADVVIERLPLGASGKETQKTVNAVISEILDEDNEGESDEKEDEVDESEKPVSLGKKEKQGVADAVALKLVEAITKNEVEPDLEGRQVEFLYGVMVGFGIVEGFVPNIVDDGVKQKRRVFRMRKYVEWWLMDKAIEDQAEVFEGKDDLETLNALAETLAVDMKTPVLGKLGMIYDKMEELVEVGSKPKPKGKKKQKKVKVVGKKKRKSKVA